MDVEATWERLRGARDLCPSPIDREMLSEAIDTIEYLQNVLERLDEWVCDFAYYEDGSKV